MNVSKINYFNMILQFLALGSESGIWMSFACVCFTREETE